MTDAGDRKRDREIEELFPWYLNGSLSEAEHARVEHYLEANPGARREMDFLSSLREHVKGEPANTPGELGFKRLQRQISDERRAQGRGPSWWRGVAVAACLLLAVQTTYQFAPFLDPEQPRVRGIVVMAPEPIQPSEEGEVFTVQVVLQPTANEQMIRSLLLKIGGQLIGGPEENGTYFLRVIAPTDDPQAIQDKLEVLRDAGAVVIEAELVKK